MLRSLINSRWRIDRVHCNSIQNATGTVAETHLVRITHPFHPKCGQGFVYIGKRYCRYGTWALLQDPSGTIFGVRPAWTDLVPPHRESAIDGDCLVARFEDLQELMHLVARIRGAKDPEAAHDL